jgi:hypothetical protein
MNPLLRPLLALASLATTAWSADAVDLKPQWLIGKRYTQEMAMDQRSTVAMAGQKMEQAMTMNLQTVITVAKHEDPTLKRLTIKYRRVAMSLDMAGQKMGFDSANPGAGNDPVGLGKSLGVLVGKEIVLIVSPDGKVKEIEHLEEVTAALDASGPMAPALKGMFNKEMFSQIIEEAGLRNVPPHPVKPGEKWPLSVQMNLAQFGQVAIVGQYTFKGMTEHDGIQCAEILSDAKLELDMNPAAALGGDKGIPTANLRFENGKVSGTTWFDPKLGTARGFEMNQEMTIKASNPLAAGETIEIPMKQKITTRLVSVEDVK